MSTVVTYNGITLSGVTTRAFRQEVVMDESDTDVLFNKFTISVEGLLHTRTAGPKWGGRDEKDLEFTTGARLEKDIRHDLSEPRKDFKMTVGNDTLLESDADIDGNNGPKTRDIKVIAITGIRAISIEFTIEICINECAEVSQVAAKNNRPVVSNRWAAKEVLDENFFCERTVEGRLRVSHIRINPQAYRHVVFPNIPEGFKFKAGNFTTTRDGLNMDYSIMYRQEFAAPPSPATKWSGTHSEMSEEGIIAKSSVQIRLEGPPDVDKKVLVTRCAEIVVMRLGQLGVPGNHIQHARLTDHFDKPVVELSILVKRVNTAVDVFRRAEAKFGTYGLRAYSKKSFPQLTSFGPQNPAEIFIMRWGNPCEGDLPYVKGEGGKEGTDPSSPLTWKTVDKLEIPPSGPPVTPYWSPDHKKNPYTQYRKWCGVYTNYNTEYLGNAEPNPSSSTKPFDSIQTSPTVTRGWIKIRATRVGKAVELDFSKLNHPDTEKIDDTTTVFAPRRGAGGQLIYEVEVIRRVSFKDRGGIDFVEACNRMSSPDPTELEPLPDDKGRWGAGLRIIGDAVVVKPESLGGFLHEN